VILSPSIHNLLAKKMQKFNISLPDVSIKKILQSKIDSKTKPIGALGRLEEIALQIGVIQNSLLPKLTNPHILVFAGDHGIARSGVSAYPQDVTWQMVMNFIGGGAAINVFCRQHNIKLLAVDAGVNYEFPKSLQGILHDKVKYGTNNFLDEPAMSVDEVEQCVERGRKLIVDIRKDNCNVVGFGEMGIGNTSSASIITSLVCKTPIQACVGRGTGLDDEGVKRKMLLLKTAIEKHGLMDDPFNILTTYGGLEIAQMTGAMLQAAQDKMIILVDGFISTAAFLIASAIEPVIKHYAIFCHQSDEQAHKIALSYLDARPLLNMQMRLGEGTGVAVAFPIVQSAVNFLNEMASFESAGVSGKI
jgi:nicotinate-nucleotide--dimethylbenzimidazole phosphoribosyltransferase